MQAMKRKFMVILFMVFCIPFLLAGCGHKPDLPPPGDIWTDPPTSPVVITSIAPTRGTTGTRVTITGYNFGNPSVNNTNVQGNNRVTFNGVAVRDKQNSQSSNVSGYISWSNTHIVVEVPDEATTGDVLVTVKNFSSNGMKFEVIPVIEQINPDSGLPGTPVSITGTGFGSSQGSSFVLFNNTKAAIKSWSSKNIVVYVPNETSIETYYVVVNVSGITSNVKKFEVTQQESE